MRMVSIISTCECVFKDSEERSLCIVLGQRCTIQLLCSGHLYWASMTQSEKLIITIITCRQNWTSRSQSAGSGVTHRCYKHMGTRPIRLAGCPGSLLFQHRCLQPGGTWEGSRSFSPGCPGCPCLTSETRPKGGWRGATGMTTLPLLVCYPSDVIQNKDYVCCTTICGMEVLQFPVLVLLVYFRSSLCASG